MASNSWQVPQPFVLNQLLGVNVLNVIAGNESYLYSVLKKNHFLDIPATGSPNALLGEHNTWLVARARALVEYSGTFGSGGTWAIVNGSGFTVANLPADTVGRGRLTFAFYGGVITQMADLLYAVFFHEMPAALTQTKLRPGNRNLGFFDFSWVHDNGAGVWSETSTNNDQFTVAVHGNAQLPAPSTTIQGGNPTKTYFSSIGTQVLTFCDRTTNAAIYLFMENGALDWDDTNIYSGYHTMLLDPLTLVDQSTGRATYFWPNNMEVAGLGNGWQSSVLSPDARPLPLPWVSLKDIGNGTIWYITCDTSAGGSGLQALRFSDQHP